jgi:hypothetical protein
VFLVSRQVEVVSALKSSPKAQTPDSQADADSSFVERTYAFSFSQLPHAGSLLQE